MLRVPKPSVQSARDALPAGSHWIAVLSGVKRMPCQIFENGSIGLKTGRFRVMLGQGSEVRQDPGQ